VNVHPQRLRRVQSFMTLAKEEETAARKLAVDLPRQAAFFAQQSVEKLLRAVIEAEDLKAGISHNIRDLAGILPESNPLRLLFVEHDELSAAATRYRYPLGSGGLASPSQSDELLAEVDRISALRTEVRRFLLGLGLLDQDQGAA
jgi:HEPN domain-containing protein